ncbi:hypothetical protein Tco_1369363 [Tanacetum coccineum]
MGRSFNIPMTLRLDNYDTANDDKASKIISTNLGRLVQGHDAQQLLADPTVAGTLKHLYVLMSSDPRLAAQILFMSVILDKTTKILVDRLIQGSNLEEMFSTFLGMLQSSHKTKRAAELNVKQNNLEAIKERSEHAFIIRVPALGFQEHNFELTVKGNVLKVFGLAVTPNGPKNLKGEVDIDSIYDSKKVFATLKHGYLEVSFPYGTKDTMTEDTFIVSWRDKASLLQGDGEGECRWWVMDDGRGRGLEVEKVRALGANGEVRGSRVVVVWMEDGGETVSARVVSRVVLGLVPEPIHTTPPNDDYVPHDTKSILDELLEEFGDEILNVIMVDDEADFNPTKDLEELEKILAKEPQSNFTEIQVDRDIISLGWYAFYSLFFYPVAYLHSKGVCYFHPHLIPSEGMDT